MKGYLTDTSKISIASTTTLGAAATTAITSSAIDMAGYDACLFIVPLGTIVTGAVTSLKVQQSSDDAATDAYDDLTGSNQAIADTDDDKVLYVDVKNPDKRYLKLVVTRGTQNATIGGIIAIQYGRRVRPQGGQTHGSNVAGEQWTRPAEGTA